jgi:hypothetical protein
MLGGESPYLVHDLVHGIAPPHLWPDRFEATGQRVSVAIAERRHQETTAEVDPLGTRGQ